MTMAATTILLAAAIISYYALDTQAFLLPLSLHDRATTPSLMMSKPRMQQQQISTPVPPPPPISMPVWSLSCPLSNCQSAMSIVTFATPVSVSSPKLWAVSLYKTSRTRCAFLGVEKSGDEYNDIAVTSSSVMSSAGIINAVRRKESMRGEGMLAADEGAVGWRASQLASRRVGGTTAGVGILQLLTPTQSKLVPILGKNTGWDETYCKKTECAKEMGLEKGWFSTSGR